MAIDPRGEILATGGGDEAARQADLYVWDLDTGRAKCQYQSDQFPIQTVCFSKDGKRILSVSLGDEKVHVWDTDSKKLIFRLDDKLGEGTRNAGVAALAPDGKTVATDGPKHCVRLWDVDTGKERCTLGAHAAFLDSISFSPDGRLLASASYSDGIVRLWDVPSQKPLATFQGHKPGVDSVAFSPDGGFLASGGEDQKVILWDTATLKEHATITAYYIGILAIAWRPDGKQLAIAGGRVPAVADKGEDGAVTLFDVATGKAVQVFTRPKGSFCSLSFSPDGKVLAAASPTDTEPISVWEQGEDGAWKKKW